MNKDEFFKKIENIRLNFLNNRNKIDANKVQFRIEKSKIRESIGNFNQGKSITGVELVEISKEWKSRDVFIDENGKPFVLYIPDITSYRGVESERKYHVSWCSTLDRMEKDMKMDRYRKKENLENNEFNCVSENDTKRIKKLDACKNCRRHISSIYGNAKYFDVSNMDLILFFEKYGDIGIEGDFSNKTYSVMYPESWREISRRLREKHNWICEECGGDFSERKNYLDVHHINGVKSDISGKNLKVLCKKCHSKEPMHEHYKAII